RLAGRVRCPAAEADEHAGGAGTHEVQRGGVGGGPADDDGHVEFVDEPFEVERFGLGGDVFGGDGGAADDEQIHAGVDDRTPVLLGALRAQRPRDGDARLADLPQAFVDELGDDRRGVDLLHPHGVAAEVEIGDLVQERLRVLVAGPEPLEVEHSDPAEFPERDRRGRAHHRVHRRRQYGEIEVVGVDLPTHRYVFWVACAPGGDDGDIVKRICAAPAFAAADLDLVTHGHYLTSSGWSSSVTRRSSARRGGGTP